MMEFMDFGHGNVPESVRVDVHDGSDGAKPFLALKLRFANDTDATFFLDNLAEAAALVTMIGDAFEKGTGEFLVQRRCGCGAYLGVGTASEQGVTTGICAVCKAKIEAEIEAEGDDRAFNGRTVDPGRASMAADDEVTRRQESAQDDEPEGAGREPDYGAVSAAERAELDLRKKG